MEIWYVVISDRKPSLFIGNKDKLKSLTTNHCRSISTLSFFKPSYIGFIDPISVAFYYITCQYYIAFYYITGQYYITSQKYTTPPLNVEIFLFSSVEMHVTLYPWYPQHTNRVFERNLLAVLGLLYSMLRFTW